MKITFLVAIMLTTSLAAQEISTQTSDLSDGRTTLEVAKFSGIGAIINKDNDSGLIYVAAIMGDGGAIKAGITAKDRLLKVDGTPLKDMSLVDAALLLRGPVGSTVEIEYVRVDDASIQVTQVTRKEVTISGTKRDLQMLKEIMQTEQGAAANP